MTEKEKQQGTQQQTSRQSGSQGGQSGTAGSKVSSGEQPGIGSSQGQDRPSREERRPPDRPSAGTADIERDGDAGKGRGNSSVEDDSLTGDPTGAFKERP